MIKLEKASNDIVKGYRRTKVLKVLDDFIKSDMDCAKVVYEECEYVKPGSCSNALSMAIKRYKYDSIVGVVTKNKTVYLYKKENSDDRD